MRTARGQVRFGRELKAWPEQIECELRSHDPATALALAEEFDA
jgi:hypothetical protein